MEVLLLNEDTIAAVATGLGGAGIGIIRISGEKAIEIGNALFINPKGKTLVAAASHQLLYGKMIDPSTKKDIDEVLISKMKAPHSYTAEDIVEINCHGGIVPLRKILGLVIKAGARLAEPGEFTKRAFLNGRLDLAQAESVIDIINAKTEKSLEYSVAQLKGRLSEKLEELDSILVGILAHMEVNIDYPEYDIEEISYEFINNAVLKLIATIEALLLVAETGKIYREGITTAILGESNVGKSSLLNALVKEKRAIVTDVPGTTRDAIEEYISIEGIPVKIVDTAGIRETEDIVEKIGVQTSKDKINEADLVILILDSSMKLTHEDREIIEYIKEKKYIVLLNKSDLGGKIEKGELKSLKSKYITNISIKTGQGLNLVTENIKELFFKGEIKTEGVFVTNIRHKEALIRARENLEASLNALEHTLAIDLASIDIRNAWMNLGEITGEVLEEDIIHKIFAEFCLGK